MEILAVVIQKHLMTKEQQQFRNELKHEINGRFEEDKISADKYVMSLDLINVKESVVGLSQDGVSQRQEIMKNKS